MKTKIGVLLATCLMGSLVQAQADQGQEPPPFRFGIHFSPNISYLATDDPDLDAGANVKFGFGLLAEYLFAPNYGLSSGLNVVNRGGKLGNLAAIDSGDYTGTVGYKQSYIQIPVLLKMRTREFGYLTFFAEFGGSLDVALEEKVKFNPDIPDTEREDSYIAPFNATFKVGIGGEYNLGGRSAVLVGIHYNRGLIDNLQGRNKPVNIQNGKYDYRFDYVSLRLGFLF